MLGSDDQRLKNSASEAEKRATSMTGELRSGYSVHLLRGLRREQAWKFCRSLRDSQRCMVADQSRCHQRPQSPRGHVP